MKIICPKCGFQGNIKDELVPDSGRDLTCPKCKNKFHVRKNISEPSILEQAEPNDLKKIETDETPSVSQEDQYQKKYEYKIEFIKESLFYGTHKLSKVAKTINDYADRGWELDKFSIGEQRGFFLKRGGNVLIFKRQRLVVDK